MDNLIINRPNYVSESEMVAVFAVALIMKRRRRRVIKPRIWSRSWVLQRQKQGAYGNLCRELEVGDMSAFSTCLVPQVQKVAGGKRKANRKARR